MRSLKGYFWERHNSYKISFVIFGSFLNLHNQSNTFFNWLSGPGHWPVLLLSQWPNIGQIIILTEMMICHYHPWLCPLIKFGKPVDIPHKKASVPVNCEIFQILLCMRTASLSLSLACEVLWEQNGDALSHSLYLLVLD